jgi:single-strand DNA-binding protein
MNTTNIIGNLCKDWELKYSQSGTAFSKNTIAVKRKFKKDESDFITVLAFGKSAELLAEYTSKGSKIGIQGRIQTGKYEKEDGTTVYTTDVVIDEFEFLDSKKTEGGGNPTPSSTQNTVNDDIDSEDSFPFIAYDVVLG